MRLFVAVDLDEAVRAAVGRLALCLGERLKAAPGALRWVPVERLHLTLTFLGEAPEPQAEHVRRLLTAPLGGPAFGVTLSGLGVFPEVGVPRVIWIGVDEGAAALARVHEEVRRRLRTTGIPIEDRRFAPHLTLARVRRSPALRSSRLREELRRHAQAPLGPWCVDHVTLYRSHLSAGGSTHQIVQQTALVGAGASDPGGRQGDRA